jgi:voltage-gated potassium channel Kch
VLAIMGAMGYRKRTGFLAGLTVAQISEFSLIFIAMGHAIGHVTMETTGLVTLVGILTISLSVYMMTYSHGLYRRLEPMLGVFERRVPHREEQAERAGTRRRPHDVVLFGSGRLGSGIAERLRERDTAILLVDFDPETVREWRAAGIDAMYGDACDHEFLAELPLEGVRWVVAALPHHEPGLTHGDPRLILLDGLRARGYAGRVAVAANREGDAESLRERGADVVFMPFEDAAERAVSLMLAPAGDAGDAGDAGGADGAGGSGGASHAGGTPGVGDGPGEGPRETRGGG